MNADSKQPETGQRQNKDEHSDYTEWQREYYDAAEPGAFLRAAADYAEAHPYAGKGKQIKLG